MSREFKETQTPNSYRVKMIESSTTTTTKLPREHLQKMTISHMSSSNKIHSQLPHRNNKDRRHSKKKKKAKGWRDGSVIHLLLLLRTGFWFPVPTWQLTNVYNPISEALTPSLLASGIRQAHGAHALIQANTHTHKNK